MVNSDENIYQSIWKFQTIGNPRESNNNDDDDDDINYDTLKKTDNLNSSNVVNVSSFVEDDHGEWETDDDFMFTNKLKNLHNDYVNFNDNIHDDSISLISSTVSTLTGISASAISMSGAIGGNDINDDNLIKFNLINNNNCQLNSNQLYRSICIFYHPIELNLNGILYDYNRNKFNQISSHKNWPNIYKYSNEKLLNCKSLCNTTVKMIQHEKMISGSNISLNKESSLKNVGNLNKRKVVEGDSNVNCGNNNEKNMFFIPDCVQAWKFMLLDICLMDDEEDMYISDNELLQLNEIHSDDKILKLKDNELDIESTQSTYQRPLFKSASTDNLLDIPLQDKKSIGEKFRDKLQRGVLKLNSKQQKDTKKSKQSFRCSFYLDDDSVQDKYPIFGVTLDDVKMSNIYVNVPLFVVDCIEIIEQVDSIQIDGLYRQSGNKTAIDDFKKKLTENYLYGLTLLKNEDIHTITGLLKSFFRELKTAIIPEKSYEQLPNNLTKTENLPIIKDILNDIPNPSKATLKYLLKHLIKVANHSHENRMPASNLAIIWGPCILMSETTGPMDIARINTLMKILIENYDLIYGIDE